jgi:hypothetical protein
MQPAGKWLENADIRIAKEPVQRETTEQYRMIYIRGAVRSESREKCSVLAAM